MSDIASMLAKANQIKSETTEGANTASRVGGLFVDVINAIGSDEPVHKEFTQATGSGLMKLFSVPSGASVIMRYSFSKSGRMHSDELFYSNTNYPNDSNFYTHYNKDFVELRSSTYGIAVCIKAKSVAAEPATKIAFDVLYSSGAITWYDSTVVTATNYDRQNAMVSSTIDLSTATVLTTKADGKIYNDSDVVVTSLNNNTLYTINASASSGAFTIPSRSDYAGTKIFTYGDGTATLNGTEYSYTSGETLELTNGIVVVNSKDNDYYDKGEIDTKLQAIEDSIASVYRYKGSCTFANLPTSGNKTGDTWNITDDFTLDGVSYKAGTNVSWTGSKWDALQGDSSSKEDKANKVTTISASSTDLQYGSAKAMWTLVNSYIGDITITID